ncbi:MAG: cytochrome P450, partial [Candidatus Binatia bacterium]
MDYNPFLPEVRDNPYPYYAALRQQAPVYEVPGMGFWVVSRYEDVFFVLKNPQVFSSSALFAAVFGDLNPFLPEAPSLLSIDPPAHTRQRKLINRAFTPRRIAILETHLHEIVRQLIEQITSHGECDLVRDFTAPFPAIAIAELLGVPPEHRHDFRRWVADLERAASGMVFTETDREGIRQSIAALRTYFQTAIAGYRHKPSDNLLSDLVRAEEENQTLTSEEVLSMALLLLLGG